MKISTVTILIGWCIALAETILSVSTVAPHLFFAASLVCICVERECKKIRDAR